MFTPSLIKLLPSSLRIGQNKLEVPSKKFKLSLLVMSKTGACPTGALSKYWKGMRGANSLTYLGQYS
jgi:hypothetical protein